MAKNKPVLESSIEDHLEQRCRQLNVFILKNTGLNGIPDRMLIYAGKHWFLELKRPGKKPTKLQEAVARKLSARGAVTLCADTRARVDAVLGALTGNGPPPGNLLYGIKGREWDPEITTQEESK